MTMKTSLMPLSYMMWKWRRISSRCSYPTSSSGFILGFPVFPAQCLDSSCARVRDAQLFRSKLVLHYWIPYWRPSQGETTIFAYLVCLKADKLPLVNSWCVALKSKETATFYSEYVFTVVRRDQNIGSCSEQTMEMGTWEGSEMEWRDKNFNEGTEF